MFNQMKENSKAFTLIELLLGGVAMAIFSALGIQLVSMVIKHQISAKNRAVSQIEIEEIAGVINKAIGTRKNDVLNTPLSIQGFNIAAFPAPGNDACGSVVLNPPCQGLRLRQSNPAGTLRKIEYETVCETLASAQARRSNISSGLSLAQNEFINVHPSLCCNAGELPALKVTRWEDESANTPVVQFLPLEIIAMAACFRLTASSVSIELGGLRQGLDAANPIPLKRTQSLSLIRAANLELLPE